LEYAKQIIGISIRLWKMSTRTWWRGRPPAKWKLTCSTVAMQRSWEGICIAW
jgi:hypothetical protein